MTPVTEEHLTDPLDIASRNAQLLNDSSLAAHARLCASKQVKNPDGTWPQPECVECGEPIGNPRLEATGTDTCIDCATRIEIESKQRIKR